MYDIFEIVKKSNIPVTAEYVAKASHAKKSDIKMIKAMLERLTREGKLVKKNNKYIAPEKTGVIEGKVCATISGADFFSSDAFSGDLKITNSSEYCVMNGDRVLARMRGNKCEIVKIIEHANINIVGTVCRDGDIRFVESDDKRLHEVFILPKGEVQKANTGDKVVAKIVTYPTKKSNGICKIKENLGVSDNDETAILSVLRTYNVDDDFDENVLAQADSIENFIKESELNGRLDLRKLTVITIDGDDAKDLDDAVSLEITEKGEFLLGVHIADVSHYVKKDSPIDIEAQKRGTSVYIPGKVFPMLPKKLSNGVCSLNEHEDRLTISCFMIISKQGNIVDYNIAPSIINSKHRMTYSCVTEMLGNSKSQKRKEYADVFGMLLLMRELAEILEKNARKRGSIDFDIPEADIRLNEDGFPDEIKPREITVSNKMIEQFMLAANQTVAAHMRKYALPCIFRVHEPPEEKKLETFREVAQMFGYNLPLKPKPRDLQKILDEAAGKDEEILVRKTMLRSMSKAKYKATCDGHFGLAYENYLHFTSPIRRYPDLFVHRILSWSFEGNVKTIARCSDSAEHIALNSTEREINAASCERDIEDIRKAQYMSKHIGEEFSGTVSGVTPYGLFIELDNTVEGFVPVNTLDGYFEYDEKHFSLSNGNIVYRLGSSAKIRVFSASIPDGKCEFTLL